MKQLKKLLSTTMLVSIVLVSLIGCTPQSTKPSFRFAASIYVGWMPWFLAAEDGTLQKNAAEEGVDIKFVQGDYIETISQYAAGGLDAVVLTNIDALALLVGSGVETDIILIGSFSHGNDAILLHPDSSLEQDKLTLGLVEFSVSHYLLDRFLDENPTLESKIDFVNVSDSEMAGAFAASGSTLDGVITWNPIVLQIEKTLDGKKVYDSSALDREIADILVIRRDVLEKNPEFAMALLRTWFDIMEKMEGDQKDQTMAQLGQLSGADRENYIEQLQTTLLINHPELALDTIQDNKMKQTMDLVRIFVDRHELVTNPPLDPWVSFPGEQKAILHFNDQPLIDFLESGK